MIKFLEIFRVGKEGPFTDDVVDRVETVIDRLETQIGHSDIVPVGINQTYRNLSSPGLANGPSFSFEDVLHLLDEFPGYHGSSGMWNVESVDRR